MIKKIFLWSLLVLLLIVGGLVAFIYYNQDYLKSQLVSEINKTLKVPVDVGNITISPLSGFPDATVHFFNVKIQDPKNSELLFAKAEDIAFSFNIWHLLKGDLVLEEITLRDAEVNIIRYSEDSWSYEIYNELEESENNNFSLDIKKLKLNNVQANYSSLVDKTSWSGKVEKAQASLIVKGPITWITVDGKVNSDSLQIEEYLTLVDQEINLSTEIIVDDHWRINTKKLNIGDSKFILTATKNDKNIIVDFNATEANVSTLLSLAPDQVKERLKNYKSNGEISLKTSWSYILETGLTSMDGELKFKNAEIMQAHPEINISTLYLNGAIKVPDLEDLTSASFSLKDIKGKINNKDFKAGLQLRNLKDPNIDLSYQGEMPLALLSDLGNLSLEEPSGTLHLNIIVKGAVASMKKTETLKDIHASGDVEFSNVHIKLPNRNFSLDAFKGSLLFNNEQLAINDLDLQLGESRFNVNGQLKNYWNIKANKPWSATAEVYSTNINLDQLLSIENEKSTKNNYEYNIPDNIRLELKASVEALTVRQFKARAITGNITVADNKLTANKLSFESMGGSVKLKGEWKDLNKNGSQINASFLLSGIHANELFHGFENFNQDFITDKNLSGKIYAEAETSLQLDSNLGFKSESLTATLTTRIVNGQLMDFAPLYKLEKYLNNADLSKVDFAELENQIYIQNETVHLPMMAVGTNITKFKIGGTHTFDQHINYDVVAPLVRKKKVDKDTKFGEVEDDKHGETLLFLSIVGTTDEFTVSLDKQAIKQEIASDVKREIKDLQDAFKKDNKTSKEVELEEDAYFDWDN